MDFSTPPKLQAATEFVRTQWRSQDFEVGGITASTKREPIWGSGAQPPVGSRAKPIFSPGLYTTLNMGSERSRIGTCPTVPPMATLLLGLYVHQRNDMFMNVDYGKVFRQRVIKSV
jgi:hypothetical protein